MTCHPKLFGFSRVIVSFVSASFLLCLTPPLIVQNMVLSESMQHYVLGFSSSCQDSLERSVLMANKPTYDRVCMASLRILSRDELHFGIYLSDKMDT
jgi:hypothetical protein